MVGTRTCLCIHYAWHLYTTTPISKHYKTHVHTLMFWITGALVRVMQGEDKMPVLVQ